MNGYAILTGWVLFSAGWIFGRLVFLGSLRKDLQALSDASDRRDEAITALYRKGLDRLGADAPSEEKGVCQ